MSDLTKQELTELRWMARANESGVGLYSGSIHRHGEVEALARLVERGLATVRNIRHGRRVGRIGYWITAEGMAALAASEVGKDDPAA